ncbi:glycine--tRNA ligase subunit alpha [Brenneria goodwinii]|nr:glycine--tRNA ligase subunit alpha [Brenneria goodwinii]MCG8163423.1 glycine--tRNA ligase subunit alpha [Brenneria goodwinii]MCG8167903.1 glycine--tRNA ligase subunit alpha [Brenneria goodwinii]MCG8172574.1 glycine--tRNA ligase subunit alpha [Brenneria goodwinii]MCG8177231.1 glycine--tRNA ligase subunit alpha [Brenneria goodwinii]
MLAIGRNQAATWVKEFLGCTIVQLLDMEVGAGSSHPTICLQISGPK